MAKKPKRAPSGVIMADMPFERYLAEDGINASAIVAALKSSYKQMHLEITGQKQPQTAAMQRGTMSHAHIWEPERFFSTLAVWTGKKKYGNAWDEFQVENEGRQIVTPTELIHLDAMSVAVHANPDAHTLIKSTRHEQSAFWHDKEFGYGNGKCRPDGYSTATGLIEYKTTACQSKQAFFHSAAKLYYHVKAGWYQEGVGRIMGTRPAVTMIVCYILKRGCECAVYTIPDEILESGRKEAIVTACEYVRQRQSKAGVQGIGSGVELYEIPAWAMPGDDLDFTGCE